MFFVLFNQALTNPVGAFLMVEADLKRKAEKPLKNARRREISLIKATFAQRKRQKGKGLWKKQRTLQMYHRR